MITACHSAATRLVRKSIPWTALAPAILAFLLYGPAAAEDARPAPPETTAAAPPANPPPERGPFSAVGSWIDQSIDHLGTGLKATQKTIDDLTAPTRDAVQSAAGVAKDAATAVVNLPRVGFVSGSERCLTAPNGAPDCQAATQALCKANGFETGRSLDTRTQAYCPPPQIKISGPVPKLTECVYVTRALCR
ncbi:MAG: hypothetical protein ACLPKB_17190 [Xanthobacteraceae bacterium]